MVKNVLKHPEPTVRPGGYPVHAHAAALGLLGQGGGGVAGQGRGLARGGVDAGEDGAALRCLLVIGLCGDIELAAGKNGAVDILYVGIKAELGVVGRPDKAAWVFALLRRGSVASAG